MSYTQFKNDFLTQAESRLDAVDLATATVQELLLHGALFKMANAIATGSVSYSYNPDGVIATSVIDNGVVTITETYHYTDGVLTSTETEIV